MSNPFEELAGLDRLVHEPSRLAILTALSAARGADFLYLQRLTGLTKGNLSTHLTKLEQAGLIEIEKEFVGKTPRTLVRLSPRGKTAIARHWQQLENLKQAASNWREEHNR